MTAHTGSFNDDDDGEIKWKTEWLGVGIYSWAAIVWQSLQNTSQTVRCICTLANPPAHNSRW